MDQISLDNTSLEPFGDTFASWDVEYISIHMLEPDYQMIIGYPLALTPGTGGKVIQEAVIVDIGKKEDLEKYRGKLKDKIILTTPKREFGPRLMPDALRHDEESLEAYETKGIDINIQKRRQDNAAGCAVALEAMRILKAIGVQPRRTIRMALWSSEEGGLRGSKGYVKEHFGNPAAAPIFEAWMKPFNDLKVKTLSQFSNRGTDHLSFDRAGLPGFQFLQDRLDYRTRTWHYNMDLYDHVLPEDLKINAVVMASFVYHAAMREKKFPRKPFTNWDPQFELHQPDLFKEGESLTNAVADFDNDGDLDLAITGAAPEGMHHLLKNKLSDEQTNRSIQILVLDEKGHYTKAGTEIRLFKAGSKELLGTNIFDTGSGYNSQNAMAIHFGLPEEGPVDVEIATMSKKGRKTVRISNVDPKDYRGGWLIVKVDLAGRLIK